MKKLFITISLILTLSCYFHPQPPVKNPLFTFGILTDIQYCDCPTVNNRNFRESLDKLEQTLKVFEENKVEFVIQLGDLIEKDWPNLDSVLKIFKKSDLPVYHLLGNHDFEIEKDKSSLLKKLKLKTSYYFIDKPGWRMIFLDGNDLSYYASPHDYYLERDSLFERISGESLPQVKKWNGGMGEIQLLWLDSLLHQANKNNQRAVLFSHFPVFPRDKHNLWNDSQILKLIASHPGVLAYISGHNHNGNYILKDGVHFWTLKAMVDSKQVPSFALVHVYKDKFVVEGFGGEISKIFKH